MVRSPRKGTSRTMRPAAILRDARTGQRKCAAGKARSSSDNGQAVARDEVQIVAGFSCGGCDRASRDARAFLVIARSQRVPPSAGPMINSAAKQSISRCAEPWIASRSLSSGAHSRPVGSQ